MTELGAQHALFDAVRDPTAKRLYVLGGCAGTAKDGTPWTPWCLHLEPKDRREAERAIAWQRVWQGAFDNRDYWQICTWDAGLKAFVDEHGTIYEPGKKPYTDAAWAAFMERLG